MNGSTAHLVVVAEDSGVPPRRASVPVVVRSLSKLLLLFLFLLLLLLYLFIICPYSCVFQITDVVVVVGLDIVITQTNVTRFAESIASPRVDDKAPNRLMIWVLALGRFADEQEENGCCNLW